MPFQTPTREIPKSEANLLPLTVFPACSRKAISSLALVESFPALFLLVLTIMEIRLTVNHEIVNGNLLAINLAKNAKTQRAPRKEGKGLLYANRA